MDLDAHRGVQAKPIRVGTQGLARHTLPRLRSPEGQHLLPVKGYPILRQWYVVHRAQHRLSAVAAIFRDMLPGLDPTHVAGRDGKRGTRASAAA